MNNALLKEDRHKRISNIVWSEKKLYLHTLDRPSLFVLQDIFYSRAKLENILTIDKKNRAAYWCEYHFFKSDYKYLRIDFRSIFLIASM